jgi:DNA-binding transcriptional regulator YiaG
MDEQPSFGQRLIESLDDALAYERGELAARTRTYERRGEEWVLASDEVVAGKPRREARVTRIAPPPTYDAARIRAIRDQLRFSQRVFAAALNVSPQTVRAWEQGARIPDGPTLRLLEIAEETPETFLAKIVS